MQQRGLPLMRCLLLVSIGICPKNALCGVDGRFRLVNGRLICGRIPKGDAAPPQLPDRRFWRADSHPVPV
jgi:hypothetical protein